MQIDWNEAYSVGVAEIDAQHQELIRRVNHLYGAIASGRGQAEIGVTLNFLGEYVAWHFASEEACMARHQCPIAEVNQTAHATFIALFDTLRRRFEHDGPTESLATDLQLQISAWIVNHILRVDTHLRVCVSQANAND